MLEKTYFYDKSKKIVYKQLDTSTTNDIYSGQCFAIFYYINLENKTPWLLQLVFRNKNAANETVLSLGKAISK